MYWTEEEIKMIKKLQEQGHSRHCAYRMVMGDGECVCGKELRDKEDEWRL